MQLSLEITHGARNTSPKADDKVRNGKGRNPQDPQEKFAYRNHKLKQCSSLSFDIKGIVHFEFIPQGQKGQLILSRGNIEAVREAVRRKSHELCPSDWIHHHDNGSAHKVLIFKHFLAQKIDY
jgi:hypothetical protein